MKIARWAPHGTYSGYQGHTRRKEEACPECKAAQAAYFRHYRKVQNGTACALGLGWPIGKPWP